MAPSVVGFVGETVTPVRRLNQPFSIIADRMVVHRRRTSVTRRPGPLTILMASYRPEETRVRDKIKSSLQVDRFPNQAFIPSRLHETRGARSCLAFFHARFPFGCGVFSSSSGDLPGWAAIYQAELLVGPLCECPRLGNRWKFYFDCEFPPIAPSLR